MARRIPLGALRVFEAAARCGSFKAAAAELSVTPGAVSRQVATLEESLGARLFERRNREVRITPAGRSYFGEIQAALARIDAASARLARRPARQAVRVDATPALALHWLIPRLPDFNARHDGIDIELSTSVGTVARNRDFDWAVRRNPRDFRGMKAEPFLEERARLMASPRLARTARLRRAEDLARCRLIQNRARPDLWEKWLAARGLEPGRFERWTDLDQTIFVIEAALDGLGLAVVPELFVADLLKTGSLVCPLGEEPVVTGAYYLVTLKKQPGEAAAAFRDWMKLQR